MDFSRIGVRMLVKDFAKSFDFYKDAIGLEVVWGDRNGPYANFKAPGGKEPNFAIFLADNMASYEGYTAPAGGHADTIMAVVPCDDVDADHVRLKALGVEFLGEPQTIEAWGMRCVVLRDPDGNLIELNDSGSA